MEAWDCGRSPPTSAKLSFQSLSFLTFRLLSMNILGSVIFKLIIQFRSNDLSTEYKEEVTNLI